MKEKKLDTTTEEKIRNAARIVFHKKGYAATRTRDIAAEAGINLALLNYYFRSKSKLFELIMLDTLTGFVQGLGSILYDEQTSLEDKIGLVASHYIDFILREPEIPGFLLTEIRSNPGQLLKNLPVKQILEHSVFFAQHREAVRQGKIAEPQALHFLLNMLGLVVFPFIAKPILVGAIDLKDKDFEQLMQERKKLIPVWIQAMMTAK